MEVVKIIVTGPFASGKTTFLQMVSEIDIVRIERRFEVYGTIVVEVGRITIDDSLILYLLDISGSKGFPAIWEALQDFPLGLLLFVNSTYSYSFREMKRRFDVLSQSPSFAKIPHLIVATHVDEEDRWLPEDIRIISYLSVDEKIVPCVTTDKESVKQVLIQLLEESLRGEDG